MAELKTVENDGDVIAFLEGIEHPRRRADGLQMLEIMSRVTGLEPRMWGDSIVGFGAYDYTYKSGHSGRWMRTGFSPRKASLTVYIMPGFSKFGDELQRIGKVKTSSSCLYINRLENIDLSVLEGMIKKSLDIMEELYPGG